MPSGLRLEGGKISFLVNIPHYLCIVSNFQSLSSSDFFVVKTNGDKIMTKLIDMDYPNPKDFMQIADKTLLEHILWMSGTQDYKKIRRVSKELLIKYDNLPEIFTATEEELKQEKCIQDAAIDKNFFILRNLIYICAKKIIWKTLE